MQKVIRGVGLSFLLLVAGYSPGAAQGTQIAGTVTSSTTSEPLWGVTVRVKGTGTQTVTDQRGRYALVAPSDAVLAFAMIGFRGAEEAVGGRNSIDVVLQQAPTMLQEVVVTGYTSQRRADITGAISSVNLESVDKQTSASVLQRLDGRVPGVTVNNSGSPGSRSTVRIRGISSFQNGEPLYIIDGTPVEAESYMNFLNANDIGEVQVLKDASSASIYGSRASNGVVIIETKKGRAGGRSMSLNVRTGVASPVRGYDDMLIQSSLDYFEVIKRSYQNAARQIPTEVRAIYGDTLNPAIGQFTYVHPAAIDSVNQWGQVVRVDSLAYAYPNTLIMPASAGTNWWKAVFSPAQYSDVNLAMAGGGSDNSYNVSFNFFKQDGTAAYSQFQRGTLRINTAFKINKITIGENLSLSREQAFGGHDDGAGGNAGEDGILGKNILSQPVVPIYDIAGNFASGKAVGLGNNTNPLKFAWARRDDRNTNDRAIGNVFAVAEVLPALAVQTRFSFNLGLGAFRGFNPTTFENSEPGTVNSINENSSRSTSWTITNTANYVRNVDRHSINVLLGQEAISENSRFIAGSIAGLLNEDPPNRYIDDALGSAATKNVSSSGTFNRLLSFFGKADYNFAEKYYASVTVRRDGSSKFGAGKQWGTFPAFNVGWRPSRESFFPQDGFFSNMMVRFGWGVTGNQRIPGGRVVAQYGGSRAETFYDISGSGTNIVAGFRQVAQGNANLQWEEKRSTNVGLDLEFLQGRGSFALDVWSSTTDKLLFDPRTPSTSGVANPPIQNIGEMNNKGVDFAAAYSGTMSGGKVWSVALNLGHYRNKVVRIADLVTSFSGPGGSQVTRQGNPVSNRVGDPIGTFYGLVANGYFPSVADAAAHFPDAAGNCATPPCQAGAEVGRIRFVDRPTVRDTIACPAAPGCVGFYRPDGTINDLDRTVIGSPHPDFTAGLDLGFRAGAWDFSATLFGSFGADIYDAQKDFYVFRDFSTNVLKDRLTDSFCITGDAGCTNPGDQSAKYPRLNQSDATSAQISSFYIEDGTYVRLRTLQVGWTVPPNLVRWIPAARVYLQAENLFTITGYPGLDPALPARDHSRPVGDVRDQYRNVDVGSYPSNRTITIGISTTF